LGNMAFAPQIAVVTTSRADFGIYRAFLENAPKDWNLGLYVTGMHLDPQFGNTVEEVRKSGYPILAEIKSLLSGDDEESVALSCALTTEGFAREFARNKPDLLVVLGDRFEMHAAALAAIPFLLPLCHIHGGEETEGAIDNLYRHSLTKLSHLHFTSTELAKRRVLAMGEDPKFVHCSGAPAIDSILTSDRMNRKELQQRFGVPEKEPFILVTYHPLTTGNGDIAQELELLWSTLQEVPIRKVLTGSNADVGGRALNQFMKEIAKTEPDQASFVQHFGAVGYYSAMQEAELMIGNSSSGIIEAASFGLPVVNLGDRQKGREQSENTINARMETSDFKMAITKAMIPEFRARSAAASNCYGDGKAANRIVEGLQEFLSEGAPFVKRFTLNG
jgi:UDP-hydrolysing UDP-N-acetyl-D-glucosamine 2-epimerase